MPGVQLTEGGWLHVSKTDDGRAMQAEADLLAGEFGAEVEFWPAERVREHLRSPLYFNGAALSARLQHPSAQLCARACRRGRARGARIYEDTPALEIDPAGVRKRVTTRDARVRAHHVVLAGNVHLAELMPQFANTLLPVHTYVIVTAPLGEALHEAIRFPGAVSDTDLADNHYRVVDGDRLMWSGRSTVWRGKPQRLRRDAARRDRARLSALADVKAEYAWTGLLGNTVHRMPQIGEISPGLWLLSGFGGHGLNTTAMGGEMLARAIVEGDRTWQLFSPFELVWAGGRLGRVAQQALLLGVARSGAVRRLAGAPPRGEAAARGGRAEHCGAAIRSGSAAGTAPPPEPAPATARSSAEPAAVEPIDGQPADQRRRSSAKMARDRAGRAPQPSGPSPSGPGARSSAKASRAPRRSRRYAATAA